jgi:PknH-like extracellular domain
MGSLLGPRPVVADLRSLAVMVKDKSGFPGRLLTLASMRRRGPVLLLALILTGCTRVVDGPPPVAQPPVAPIAAGQITDLLSEHVKGADGNLFVTVEPDECAGLAREVDPPFIADNSPASTDGGHWVAEAGRDVFIEEMVGVYRADFSATRALESVKRTIDDCRGSELTVTSMRERKYVFELLPTPDSGSPSIVLWSYKGDNWACDSAFIAAHNAAIEISTCSPSNGYDVLTLAQEALKRIEKLANTTA